MIFFERIIAFDQPGSQMKYEERYKTLLNFLSAEHPFIESTSHNNISKIILTLDETMGYRKHCLESMKPSTYINSIINAGTKHKFPHIFFDFLGFNHNLARG